MAPQTDCGGTTDSGNASSPNSSSSVAYNNDTYVSVEEEGEEENCSKVCLFTFTYLFTFTNFFCFLNLHG